MVSKVFIDRLHELSIEKYGGSMGIRDEGLLESAIARPFQTFDAQDLYPHPLDKAAAIGESIIINHPYIDGNKRTGFLAMFAVLDEYGLQLTATEEEAYQAMIQVSTGEMGFEGLREWLGEHTILKVRCN
jgi:death-on-curing protein